MHLDQWLREVYDDEVLTKEASDLEVVFDQMTPEALLEIATGGTTIEKVALWEGRDDVILKKVRDVRAGLSKKSAARLEFMDKVARQVAREHLEVEKQARIFGERMPYHEIATGEIPYKQRESAYRQYVRDKARESPTEWGAALGGGALVGGAAGGMMGAGKAGLRGAAIGIPIGALGGAGVGAVARMADAAEIDRVRDLAKDRKAFKRDMSRQVSEEKYRQQGRKTLRRERRHQDMVDAIRDLKRGRG